MTCFGIELQFGANGWTTNLDRTYNLYIIIDLDYYPTQP